MINSLKAKLIFVFILMIMLTIFIEALNLTYIRLPQFYSLEAISDRKDINRIKIAFKSISDEMGIINYDNAVWNETFEYISNRNKTFTQENFVLDAFKSIGLNGIYIYDNQGEKIWGETWDKNKWQLSQFAPFDKPSAFVKAHLLSSPKLVAENNDKPLTRSGYTLLENKLILFAATSVFRANLTGKSNGTMVFWRFIDQKILEQLQNRSGIKFTINVVDSIDKDLLSNDFRNTDVYRNERGLIFDYYPLFFGSKGIKFTYNAPVRQFDDHWFNQSTLIMSLLFSVTFLIVTLLVHYAIIRPILKAEKFVSKVIQNNDLSVRLNSSRSDELGTLFNLIDRLLDDVSSQEQGLISHNLRLQIMSRTDGLTNIANRRAFDIYMNKLLVSSAQGSQVSLLICDVDYFKKYNDCYGHAKGDNALRLIAESLQKNLHEYTDFVARYGGEEFVIVLKNTNEAQAKSVANNLLECVRALKIEHKDSEVLDIVTISLGAHTFNINGTTNYEAFFEVADKALYKAKEQGRNRICSL